MMAGLAMQLALQRYDVRYKIVDRPTMERISGTALDFLIVAAVASVNVAQLAKEIVPFLLLMVAGLVADVLCVLYLAPLMNPTYWFENGIACFGQDTGVIAAGLMLLRMVDPEGVTGVPRAFGYKQPVHAALMGGGIATAAFIPLQASIGLAASTCVTAARLFQPGCRGRATEECHRAVPACGRGVLSQRTSGRRRAGRRRANQTARSATTNKNPNMPTININNTHQTHRHAEC